MNCHTLTSDTFFTITCKLDNVQIYSYICVVYPSRLAKVHNLKKYWALLHSKKPDKIYIFYLVTLFSEVILKTLHNVVIIQAVE